jgi:cellulose synthase/poly-beta-1,6-N-acetylglucosamine synthase-like glycosyltransferase
MQPMRLPLAHATEARPDDPSGHTATARYVGRHRRPEHTKRRWPHRPRAAQPVDAAVAAARPRPRFGERRVVQWAVGVLVLIMAAGPFLEFVRPVDVRTWLLRSCVLLILVWYLGRPLAVLLFRQRERKHEATDPLSGISVVIPCHNVQPTIVDSLRSVLEQDVDCPIEVLLVENNSTDDTMDRLFAIELEHPETVHVLRVRPSPDEFPAAVAVNFGIQRARYDVIVRMDDDTTLAPSALREIVRQLRRPGIVGVACNLRVANPKATVWTRFQSIEYMLAMELDRRSQVLMDSIVCASGGLSAFRRDAMLDVGGYSTVQSVSEDLELTLKCQKVGRIAMAPKAIGYTSCPPTLPKLLKQRVRWGTNGTIGASLHVRGFFNRTYWSTGMTGFYGLPTKFVATVRELLPIALADMLWQAFHLSGWAGLLVLIGFPTAIQLLQILILAPALVMRQGLRYVALSPVFLFVYGPLLTVARFVGGIRAAILFVPSKRRSRADNFAASASEEDVAAMGLATELATS